MINLLRKVGIAAALLLIVVVAVSCAQQASTPPAPSAPAAAPTAAPQPPLAQPTAPAASSQAAPAATAAPASAAPTAAPAAAAETLKVGFILPITGNLVRVGMNSERFARLAVDDVNAAGGVKVGGKVYKLEADVADSGYTSEGGRTAADRLVLKDKVRFVLGSMLSDTPGAQAITDPNKVLMLAYSVTDESLSDKHPLAFQAAQPHVQMRSPALYDALVKNYPNAKKVALIGTDDPLGHSTSDNNTLAAKAHGLTVSASEFFPVDAKDFAPIATRVMREQPDVIDIGAIGAAPQTFVPLAKALRELGFKGPMQGMGGVVQSLLDNSQLFEGYTTAALIDWQSSQVTDREKQVLQKYVAKYSVADLEPMIHTQYNLVMVLAQALEKAGTVEDTQKIADTLRAGEWDNIWGKAKFVGAKIFGRPVVMSTPIYMTKLQGGKLVTVDRILGTLP